MKHQMSLTVHDLCYAMEALEKHAKNEKYRPEHVMRSYERFKRAWELIIQKDVEGKVSLIIE